jgi:hypothetical protein
MVNSEKLISTVEYLTLEGKCRTNRCRYNGQYNVMVNSEELIGTAEYLTL